MTVNILGTKYTISIRSEKEDKNLEIADGYCDKTSKEIVIVNPDSVTSTLKNPDWYFRKVKRHEIVHAFLIESGLQENTEWNEELIVDYFACQGEKIYKAWKEADCL